MKDRYLVTGATGFVGANLVRELVRQKKHVSIIVRDKKLNFRLRDIASKIEIFESDLRKKNLDDTINSIRPTIVYHLAAYGVPHNQDNVDMMIDINIRGTLNLINAVKKHPFRLFIHTGTFSEYGVKEKPMKETDILVPINDYGFTKAAATLLAQKVAIRENLPIVTFRLFYVYGYYEVNRFIPAVILSALKNSEIRVSHPAIVRDFVFVDDVVDAYMKAKDAHVSPGSIINIGSGTQHTLGEAVDIIIKLTKSKSKVAWGTFTMQRHIESSKSVADIRLAKEILRWKPRLGIYEGIQKTVLWFKKHSDLYTLMNRS